MFEFVSDYKFIVGAIFGIVAMFAAVKAYYPTLVVIFKKKVDEAVIFVEAQKDLIPPDYAGAYEDFKMCLADLDAALEDDKLDYKEVYLLMKDILALADEIKMLIKA